MNKIQKIGAVLAAVALTATATQVSAMSENWSAGVSRFLTLDGGTTGLAQGSVLKLGILSTSEANMIGNENNLTFINANFNTWATSSIGTGSPIDGTFADTSTPPGAGFFSTQLYVLAFSPGNTQVGLFSAASWISPASDGAAANSLEFSDADVYAIIGALSTGTVTSPTDLAGGDAAALHQIPVVPEPSSLMLVGLGLAGMVGLIRRRS